MQKSKCGCCKEEKFTNEFYHCKGRIRRWCKECDTKYTILRQTKFKEKCVEYKGGKCEECGYDKYIGALDFHHTDPLKKDFTIAHARLKRFDESVIKELDKCQLLCANCHREVHQVYNTEELEQFFNKPRKEKAEYFCKCGNKRSKRAKLCKVCQNSTATNRSVEDVIAKIKETNWVEAGKHFGVTDNALRKFLRRRNIDIKSLESRGTGD